MHPLSKCCNTYSQANCFFLFEGYFSHPIDQICNIGQAFTLQSMAIFRGSFLIFEGSFLHFGGEIAGSPRVIFSLLTVDL